MGRPRMAVASLVAVVAGCGGSPSSSEGDADTSPPEVTEMPPEAPPAMPTGIIASPTELGAECDPTRSVLSDGAALLSRDPEVLAQFSLERVLAQIVGTRQVLPSGTLALTAVELLQRLFDTENTTADGVFADNVHCDDSTYFSERDAFGIAPPVDCPRAEGALAASQGFFVPDDPDHFVPVAIVNRFDLLPDDFSTCGEYRIIYAKWSGRSDPADRVFMIFEAALENPDQTLSACRPVAEALAHMDDASSTVVADLYEAFYFDGLPGFVPVVHADHYSQIGNCSYGAKCGQVRVGQGMQAPWEFRQFRLVQGAGQFIPTVVSNSPSADWFDAVATDPLVRSSFVTQVHHLANAPLSRMRMKLDFVSDVQSAVDGAAKPTYLARVTDRADTADGAAFIDAIDLELSDVAQAPCGDDPITHESVLQRGEASTCAGCHAPRAVLSDERGIGCGLTWPDSLGVTHIDEHGELSEALTAVYLPDRASVLTTYLQACDEAAILANLEPVPAPLFAECFVAGTPITMADGATKAIEQIVPGERVLTFDQQARRIVTTDVVSVVERPHTDSLVVINDHVVATTNHPFYSAGRWVRAGELDVGMPLLLARNVEPSARGRHKPAAAQVEQLMLKPGSVPTYNIEVAEHHAYFAGGVLVHDRP